MVKKLFLPTVFCILTAFASHAQIPFSENQAGIFDREGRPSSFDAVVDAASRADVLFLGELHDDAVAHAFQMEILRRLYDKVGAERRVILSMEMFERDVQIVLDEYLNGQITENHFISSSRAWPNYKTDYRPLVEFAKEKRLAVIAANAPRRYVNMVSRGGRGALSGLSRQAKSWLAPLPFAEPSPAYAAKFKSLMGSASEARMGLDNILASQALWDATMADSIADALKRAGRPLVIHLNGAFHSDGSLGTVEHLKAYRKKADALVVSMRYEKNFRTFDESQHKGLGNFVILTDAAVPRSRR